MTLPAMNAVMSLGRTALPMPMVTIRPPVASLRRHEDCGRAVQNAGVAVAPVLAPNQVTEQQMAARITKTFKAWRQKLNRHEAPGGTFNTGYVQDDYANTHWVSGADFNALRERWLDGWYPGGKTEYHFSVGPSDSGDGHVYGFHARKKWYIHGGPAFNFHVRRG